MLGAVPGPILFGFAMDHNCVLWEKLCDGSTGSCLFYDNHRMAWLLLAVCSTCKVLTSLCSLVAWRIYVAKQYNDTPAQPTPVPAVSAGGTGNDATGNSYTSKGDGAIEMHGEQFSAASNPTDDEWGTINL